MFPFRCGDFIELIHLCPFSINGYPQTTEMLHRAIYFPFNTPPGKISNPVAQEVSMLHC